MKILKVPYAEKDQAKALGARWNKERKVWYVPDGEPVAPFEKWIMPGQADDAPAKPAKVDSYSGASLVGQHFFALEHDCSPYTVCAQCEPILAKAGWAAENKAIAQMLAALKQR